jgi:hypothetical protein
MTAILGISAFYHDSAAALVVDGEIIAAVEIGREEGATICDLVPQVDSHPRRRDLYTHTGVHVTKEGAELYAAELCKTLTGAGERGPSGHRKLGSETVDQPARTGR